MKRIFTIFFSLLVLSANALDTPVISGPSEVCDGADPVTFSTQLQAGASYSWLVPEGAVILDGHTTNAITVDFGQQSGYVTVAVAEADLIATSELYVSVLPVATPSLTLLPDYTEICEGDFIAFSASVSGGAPIYRWFRNGVEIPGATTPDYLISPEDGDVIMVEVYFAGSCVEPNTLTAETVIHVTPLPSQAVTAPDIYTSGTSEQLLAGTYNYEDAVGLWTHISGCGTIASPSDSLTFVEGLCPGQNVFVWTVSNVCGSSSDTLIINVADDPQAQVFGPDIIVSGEIYVFSVPDVPGAEYFWTVPADAYLFHGQGTHKIWVQFGTGSNQKVAAPGDEVCVERTISGTTETLCRPAEGVVTGNSAVYKDLKAYPNPFSDRMVLDNLPADAQITISDIHGTVLGKSRASGSADLGEALPEGVYFVTVTTGKGSETIKVVKSTRY